MDQTQFRRHNLNFTRESEVVTMTETGALVVRMIFSLAGLRCIIFAYFIGAKGKITLIAGYVPSKVKNEKGLARLFGIQTLIIGLFTMVFPWVYGFNRTTPLLWLLYYCVPIVILVLIVIIVSSRFERKSTVC